MKILKVKYHPAWKGGREQSTWSLTGWIPGKIIEGHSESWNVDYENTCPLCKVQEQRVFMSSDPYWQDELCDDLCLSCTEKKRLRDNEEIEKADFEVEGNASSEEIEDGLKSLFGQ